MGTSNHLNMQTLSDQLGLSSSPEKINPFIQSHYIEKTNVLKTLRSGLPLNHPISKNLFPRNLTGLSLPII